MEDTLLSKLTVAQGIIKDSDKHYDIADAAEQELQRTTKKYNHRMIAVVIIGLLVYILIPDDNFIISWLFKLIAIGAFGFALYYFYQEKAAKVKELIGQIRSERQIGDDIINNNIEKLEFLQDDYWYPVAIDYIIKVVEAGRAGDLNQALSMCDEQLHRWRMEDANADIQNELKRQTGKLSSIEKIDAANATINLMDLINKL